jgi:hypothetical protein
MTSPVRSLHHVAKVPRWQSAAITLEAEEDQRPVAVRSGEFAEPLLDAIDANLVEALPVRAVELGPVQVEEVADRGELGDVRDRRRPRGVGPPRAPEADPDERDARRVGVERGPPVPREQAALRDPRRVQRGPVFAVPFTVAL